MGLRLQSGLKRGKMATDNIDITFVTREVVISTNNPAWRLRTPKITVFGHFHLLLAHCATRDPSQINGIEKTKPYMVLDIIFITGKVVISINNPPVENPCYPLFDFFNIAP